MHVTVDANDLQRVQQMAESHWVRFNENTTNETLPQGYHQDPNLPENRLHLKNSSHPAVCVGTVAFKALAIFYFLFYTEIMETNLILAALNVSVFVLVDFWFTKEFAGRILLGLEWWINWYDDSRQSWHFNSENTEFSANRVDRVCFWYSQYIAVGYWGIMSLGSVLTFSFLQLAITLAAFLISLTNLFNFYKCSKEQQLRVRHLGDKGLIGKIERAGIEAATHLVPENKGLNPFGALKKYPGEDFNKHGNLQNK